MQPQQLFDKWFDKWFKKAVKNGIYDLKPAEAAEEAYFAAFSAAEELFTAEKWIDSKKKLPDPHPEPYCYRQVLVYCPEYHHDSDSAIHIGFYLPSLKIWRIGTSPIAFKVRWWMYMPDPPK